MKRQKPKESHVIIGCFLAILACQRCLGQTILYVDADATIAAHDGSSWCSAFVHLQDALAIASFGDEIRVANGTYRPDLGGGHTLGDREASFYLVGGVTLRGGYAGCGAADPDDRDISIYETVLSGDLDDDDGPDFLNYDENSYHVVANDDPSTSAQNTILDGFTVSHGYANGPNFGPSPASKDQGGGVNLYYGPVTLTFCTFRDNWQSNHGSVNDHAGAVITQCEFLENESEGWGAGLFVAPGINTVVQDSAFRNNHTDAALGGGGAAAVGGDAIFTNCDFFQNTSFVHGGGLYIHGGASPTITDCTLSQNIAYFNGGGVYCELGQPTILKTDFVGNWAHINAAANGGGGIFFVQSDPYVSDCRFSGNSVAVVGLPGRGGGIYSVQSTITIRKSVFVANQAGDGGGVFVASHSVSLFNCTLSANRGSSGSAVYCGNSAAGEMVNCLFVANHGQAGTIYSYGSKFDTTLINCTVFGNTTNAPDRAGILNVAGRHANVYNSILWGNGNGQSSAQIFLGPPSTLDFQNSLSQAGSFNPGDNPLFVDPAGADGTLGTDDDELQPGPGSPAIDAGNNTVVPADTVDLDDDLNTTERTPLDLDGNPRFVDDPDTVDSGVDNPPTYPYVVDIGAYETTLLESPSFALSPRNRYISIDPRGTLGGNPSSLHIRVMVDSSLVTGHAGFGPWWAAQPDARCISYLTTTKPAVEPDWSACPVVHLTGCPIIPTTTYAIASEADGEVSADGLFHTQIKPGIKWHGDCVGFFTGAEWTAANGQTTIDDAVAAIKTFQNPSATPGCPAPPCNATHVSVTDMEPNLTPGPQINAIVNIADVFSIILGFQGSEYPGPDLTQCP